MRKIRVKYIPNVLHSDGRRQKDIIVRVPVTVRDILNTSHFPYEGRRIIFNSRPVADIDTTVIDSDGILIITHPVRDPATIVAAITTVVSWVIENWQLVLFLATTAYSVYQYINRPSAPSFGTSSDGLDDGSPTASWSGIATTQDAGIPIPIVYGTFRLGGNIINQFVSNSGDKSYLNILLGLCEGEIESIGSILINDNPAENFDGITQETRTGTPTQSEIANFNDLHNVIGVNANLTKGNAYIYTTIDDNVESFEQAFKITQGRFKQNASTGAIAAWAVTMSIEYKLTTSGGWTPLGSYTISGRSRTALRRTYRKTDLVAGKYDIRVTRTSDDSSLDPAKTGDLVLQSVDEIKKDDLIYPNLALLGLKAMATDQLSGSTPNITCLVKGTKVSVPRIMNGASEAAWDDYYWDPDTEQYKLISDDTLLSWDGSTYVTRYSANPIWCVKDMLLNNRYGLGDTIDSSNISDSDYLEMSRVCEQKVDDGDGGYEKLYRLDVCIDSRTRALDVITQLATAFDAFVFYSEGSVRLKIDTDDDPVQYFGMGTILQDSLKMSWKSKRETYNLVRVQFQNQDKNYVMETVSVVDETALASGEAFRETTVRIMTTKLSYAIRAGRRALKVSQLIKRTFTFKVSIDALAVTAGDVIGFSHDVPQIGFSGRILTGSTLSSIKLDQSVTIEAGKSYKIVLVTADDSIFERDVTNSPGTTDTLTIDPTLSVDPAGYDRYAFGEANIYYKRLRIVGLSMDRDLNAELSAIEVDSNVYDYSAPVIPQDKYSVLSTEILDVEDLAVTEMIVKANDGTLINTIEVWFQKPIEASYYLNAYKKARVYFSDDGGDSWIPAGETDGNHLIISDNIITGQTYLVAVVSVSKNGMENAIANSPQGSITIQGKAAAPSNVSGFDASQDGDKIRLVWDPIPDGDLARYVIKQGTNWITGLVVAEKVDVTTHEIPVGTIGEVSFMIKAVDTSGNESAMPAKDTLTVTPPPEQNFVVQMDPWAQNREYKLTNVARIQRNDYDPYYTRDVFVLMTATGWNDAEGGDWEGLDLDSQTVVSSGSIEQTEPIDLGTTFEFKLLVDFRYKNVAGGTITLQISYSVDGTTYTSFEDVNSSTNYRARYILFNYVIETSDTSQQFYFYAGTIYINAATTKVDFGRDLLIAVGGTEIIFRDDLTETPRITALAIKNGVRGIPIVTAIDYTGMTVKVRDPETAAYIGTAEIDWEVRGS